MSKDDGIRSPGPKAPRLGARQDRSEPSAALRSEKWKPEQIAASRRVLEVLLDTKGFSRKDLDSALERPLGSTSRFLRDKEGFSPERLERMLAYIGVRMEEFVRMRDANLPGQPPQSAVQPDAPPALDLQGVFRKLEEIRQALEQRGLEGGPIGAQEGPPDDEK